MARTIRKPAHERREQILAEALRLFARQGMANVSTRQIAKAVGISQPSLYAHFRSRDEIAIEVARRAFLKLRNRMEAVSSSNHSARERLRLMGKEYVRFGLEESDAYRMAFILERRNLTDEDRIVIHQAGMHGFSIVQNFFQDELDGDDRITAAAAQSAWASMHGLVSLLLTRPDFPWVEQEALIETHLDRLCRDFLG